MSTKLSGHVGVAATHRDAENTYLLGPGYVNSPPMAIENLADSFDCGDWLGEENMTQKFNFLNYSFI